jgi:hypothetical protein
MSYCSPGAINKKYCYSFQSLKLIALAYNFLKQNDKIKINNDNDADKLYLNIKEKFNKYMKINDNNHWAWLDIIRLINRNKNAKITSAMKSIEINELKPSQPIEWINNKTEWLSNFDIEKVMIQYEKDKTFNYKFHGVFTIDFGLKNKDGTCKYYDNCEINMKDIITSGKKYFGFITNLCKNDEPGTHWTSSFFILDPEYDNYGAYYYDSVKRPIPRLLKPVFDDIQKQMNKIYPNKKFNINVNNIPHQKSNTECGVFSIAFQTRWLILLRQNKTTGFKEIINFSKINDDVMKMLRNKFYRPNVRSVLKKNG